MSESILATPKKPRVRVVKKPKTEPGSGLLDIHGDIRQKLQYFIAQKKIPNIIFHGVSGCGKNTLAWNFIRRIYGNDKVAMKDYVMHVNCAHGKGIRFIREDLKFFAKTNVDLKDGEIFKSVILLNADKLTTDAQSALRRCAVRVRHTPADLRRPLARLARSERRRHHDHREESPRRVEPDAAHQMETGNARVERLFPRRLG